MHDGFLVPDFDSKERVLREAWTCRRSELTLTAQKRATGGERECDLSRNRPPFHLVVEV